MQAAVQPVFQDFSPSPTLYGLLSPLGRVSILGPTSIYTLHTEPAGQTYTMLDHFFLFLGAQGNKTP